MVTVSPHLFNFVTDLETSGSCPIKHGVISGTMLVTDLNLNVIDEFNSKVCPPGLSPYTWSLEAQEKHGYSVGEVMNFKSNDQFCYELLCFLAKYKRPDNFPQPLIFHASRRGWYDKVEGYKIYPYFDYHFLEWAFRKAHFNDGTSMVFAFWKLFSLDNVISTVEMGRKAGYKKNRLNEWAERLGFILNHHEDRSDAYGCLNVLRYLREKEHVENSFGN